MALRATVMDVLLLATEQQSVILPPPVTASWPPVLKLPNLQGQATPDSHRQWLLKFSVYRRVIVIHLILDAFLPTSAYLKVLTQWSWPTPLIAICSWTLCLPRSPACHVGCHGTHHNSRSVSLPPPPLPLVPSPPTMTHTHTHTVW